MYAYNELFEEVTIEEYEEAMEWGRQCAEESALPFEEWLDGMYEEWVKGTAEK